MIRKNIEQNPDYYVSRIPVGRVAQPQKIADIGVFMVSPKTSYMTGSNSGRYRRYVDALI